MARGIGGVGPSRGVGGGSNAFAANFPGECWVCEERINRGDMIRYRDDEVVHEDCFDGGGQLVTPQTKACSTCFEIHAGGCA